MGKGILHDAGDRVGTVAPIDADDVALHSYSAPSGCAAKLIIRTTIRLARPFRIAG